ncbi:hypothetical protein P3X46_031991 [Hevea brasiliensis]|uniref:Subtilisin-like protease fibronectin type-III domain-containing protein n=1 Tax=Hevea brasiliensis TaxID=3981 RepID=A0ABQ9KMR1_HEVBR|nr:hypothetical protein P3X46_031991 [Hevea brasiliensis]
MGSMGKLWLLPLVLLSALSLLSAAAKKTYLVHMNHNSKPHTHATHRDWYQSLTSTSDSILYTYNAAFHGFAAYLDPEEADSLGNIDAVLNVFESRMNSLKTTRTPEFLCIDSNFGLGDGRQFQEIEQAAHNVIIGVIDSGVWPESRSFDDTGLPEIPKRWKGKCVSAKNFNPKLCNKKLIGARYFLIEHEKEFPGAEVLSPRDYSGHGTHTASTAAAGIAALIKAAHPSWSPSAIKSAMMTTAYNLDNTLSPIRDVVTGKPANPWDYGSGHIDPTKALSPGLVYDISKEDYTKFLCSLRYPHDTIEVFMSHLKLNISWSNKFSDLGDLNYPSFSVLFKNKTSIQHGRELTNVGPVNSMYEVTVTAPSTVQVSVKPAKMVFKKVGEKQRYTVTFKNKKNKKAAVGAAFGWIVWSNAQYKVSSPVAFTWT